MSRITAALAGVCFVATLAALVVLLALGKPTTDLITIATPVLGYLYVKARSDRQDEALTTISHNTNGVLTERIERAVSAALDKREYGRPGGDSPS